MAFDLTLRTPHIADLPGLAEIWHEGWHSGHAAIVPPALTRLRTRDNFEARLGKMMDRLRMIGPTDAPLGFCAVKDDELYQMYAAAAARGKGVAQILIRDGEKRIAASGYKTAFLHCSIGNERAAQFYRKCGWHLRGEEEAILETSAGPFPLVSWVFEKQVG